MVKRSAWMVLILALAMVATACTRADACGCGVCVYRGCFPFGNAYYGAGNCGLGWGACGSAWWFGYGGYGLHGCGYGCRYNCATYGGHHCCLGHLLFHHRCGRGGCGYGGCGYGGCGYGGRGYGGCGDGGCVGCQTSDSSGATSTGPVGDSHIIYERTVPAGQGPETTTSDRSASLQRSPIRLASAVPKDGTAAFEKGLTELRHGKPKDALGDFDAAANAEPENALYHYHRAVAMFDVAGADAAQEALSKAVELESREPIKSWGKRMERVQGRARVWVEAARRDAGLVH